MTINVLVVVESTRVAAYEDSIGAIMSVVRHIARYMSGFLYAIHSTRVSALWRDCEKKKRSEKVKFLCSGENIVLPELPRSENISLRMVEVRDALVL